MAPIQSSGLLPITVLTGFLGAGKTTLLNRILHEQHGRRVAVIVNEFGELGIDAALIRNPSGSVLELANGCICCATQGDLARTLRDLAPRRSDLDALLIETSGLADPAPVVSMLQSSRVAGTFRLDGVVTIIDAENFDRNLEEAEVAYQQITGADITILNKVDTVEPDVVSVIEAGIMRLNRRARIITAVRCDVEVDLLFGLQRGLVAEEIVEVARGAHSHRRFESIVLRVAGIIDPERFDAWLDALPREVLRLKGFVLFAGNERHVAVHLVGKRRSADQAPDDLAIQDTTLVVIGRDLDGEALQRGLEECRR